jgi:hypothetical protein
MNAADADLAVFNSSDFISAVTRLASRCLCAGAIDGFSGGLM